LVTTDMHRKLGDRALFMGDKTGSASNTMWPGTRPIPPCQFHVDPSNRLATVCLHQRYRETGQTDRQDNGQIA